MELSEHLLDVLHRVSVGSHQLVPEVDLKALLDLGLITKTLGGFTLTDAGRQALLSRTVPRSRRSP